MQHRYVPYAKPNTRANKQPDIGTNATTYSIPHPEPHASVSRLQGFRF